MVMVRSFCVALLALACFATTANAQTGGAEKKAPQAAQIDRNGVLTLVRSTILAVQHGNQTGNYTVLRDLGAAGFQQANTAARLSEIFADLRGKSFDLSGVAVLEPQLSLLPQIEANGMMRMAGSFPSVPLQVNFELLFAPDGGKWKLFGIALNLGDSGPAPPAPASPPAPPAAARKEPAKAPPAAAAPRTQQKPQAPPGAPR